MRRSFISLLALLIAVPAFAQTSTTDTDQSSVLVDAEANVKQILQNGDKAKFEEEVVRADADGKQVVCGKVTRPSADGFMNNIRYFVLKDSMPRLLNRDMWQQEWQQLGCGAIPAGEHELTPEELEVQKLRRMKMAPTNPVQE